MELSRMMVGISGLPKPRQRIGRIDKIPGEAGSSGQWDENPHYDMFHFLRATPDLSDFLILYHGTEEVTAEKLGGCV